jgi:hypothetical protein
MSETPTFENPPIVEFVLGVQFSPLTKLSAGHYGLLWKELGDDWGCPEDSAPIPDQFEIFDRPRWSHRSGLLMRLGMSMPVGRFILHHRSQNRLVQVQASRVHLNWRKTSDLKPSYKVRITEFEEKFERFRLFIQSVGLGELKVNQWVARIEELRAFQSLEDNWDGDGSMAPGYELVDGAVALAQSLRMRNMEAPDRVIVGVNGTIFFEWHTPLGYYEIEVDSTLDAEARWVQNESDNAVVTHFRHTIDD